ncbi:LysR family transcriptional regulator [Magnetospirillum sulfuroxidans]|uniref:LysR family transcriptional regulator n=1 Tax=Magnetospirillum sulfuroxidans TaxID=611300 RepID=A0ABS5IBE4_9PROT|nr:LysR family transcriptional regulator [Magnetospirillum sulfuroxidans]MBR9971751.1 LysR family transcriptional regulator [Magnetospirillum sulfuroxidans]
MNRWDGIDEFVAVAETGSFSQAAKRLRVSSSQVSRQVAALEDRLHTPLFYRTTRSVALTETGRTLLGQCQSLIAGRDAALASVNVADEEPWGLLRMTCSVAYGEMFVMPLVTDFLQRHPGLRVEVDLTNATLDLVQGGYDLAVRLGRLSDSSLIATRLAPRVMYLCAAPDYLARHGRPTQLAALAEHQCLIGTSDTWILDDGGREWPFKPRGRWRCNSGSSVLHAALRGLGICQLPDYYVQEHLRAGRLESVLDAHRPPHTGVWAVYPERRHLSAKVRRMIALLKEGLAARPEYGGGSASLGRLDEGGDLGGVLDSGGAFDP